MIPNPYIIKVQMHGCLLRSLDLSSGCFHPGISVPMNSIATRGPNTHPEELRQCVCRVHFYVQKIPLIFLTNQRLIGQKLRLWGGPGGRAAVSRRAQPVCFGQRSTRTFAPPAAAPSPGVAGISVISVWPLQRNPRSSPAGRPGRRGPVGPTQSAMRRLGLHGGGMREHPCSTLNTGMECTEREAHGGK